MKTKHSQNNTKKYCRWNFGIEEFKEEAENNINNNNKRKNISNVTRNNKKFTWLNT